MITRFCCCASTSSHSHSHAHSHARRMSIEKTRGRQGNICDSGYYRLFESQSADTTTDAIAQRIARLVSKIHSASICNGNKLEEFIGSADYNLHAPKRNSKIMHLSELASGHYLNIKFEKELWDTPKSQSTEIDYMLVRRKAAPVPAPEDPEDPEDAEKKKEDIEVALFEIKDGDTFDTKKSREELNSLKEVSNLITKNLPGASVLCYVVLWNVKDIAKNGFKAKLPDGITLINGRMMCDIVKNIEYEKILHSRKEIGDKNLEFCINELRNIVTEYDNVNKKRSEEIDELSDLFSKGL